MTHTVKVICPICKGGDCNDSVEAHQVGCFQLLEQTLFCNSCGYHRCLVKHKGKLLLEEETEVRWEKKVLPL